MVNRDNTPQVLGALRHNFPIETQFAVLAVTPDGKITIHASDALKPYCDKWYHDGVRSDALAAVASIAGRKRSHVGISVPVGQPSATPVAGNQANATTGQMISPPPEDLMESSNPSGEHPSPSSASAGRPKKKPRRISTDSQISPIDTSVTPQKRIRQRKVGIAKPNKATPFIKTEINDNDGEEVEKDWETMETPINGSRDEDGTREEGDAEEEQRMVSLCIGDEAAVANYLWRKFVQIQQLDCKVIAKAWVKVIEPKKQAHSPYNGGDATRPWWWPDDAPHKEPDHLLKNARIRVLVSCISDQLVPISQLRAATDETSLRPSQKEILHEMYDVMELDQRMRAGELDRDHIRFVRPFVKGNKRRKKRTLKNPPSDSKHQAKKQTIKREDGNAPLNAVESEVPMIDIFKTEEDDVEDSVLAQHPGFSPTNTGPTTKSQPHTAESQLANMRRQSTGVIVANSPIETPLLGLQSRSHSVPSLQHATGLFDSSYIPSAQAFAEQKMDTNAEMSDSSQQPFDWTPSPTLASPVYTQITSPGITCPILTPTQATSASAQPAGYTFADIDTRSMFDTMVQTQIPPNAPDIAMLGTNDTEIYVSPVMGTSYNSDAYTAYALQGVQAFPNYSRQFFPSSTMQDTAMLDGTSNFSQQTFP